MQKLKGLNTLKSNILIKLAHKNISNSMRFRRYYSGIDLKPEEFVTIGKEFKTEMSNNNLNRAVEILGKYNDKTLNKILDYNNPLMNINLNLNNFPLGSAMNKSQNTKEEKTDKENSTNNKNEKTSENASNLNNNNNENSEAKKDENKKKNISNFEIFNYTKSYEKVFTPEEIEMIKQISADKEKLVEYLRANSLALDSLILRNHYTTSVNVKGLRRENKLIYILLAIFIFWMSYDSKGTLKCKFFSFFFF